MLSSKPVVPRDRPLIYISYKYNVRKVLYFIVTENSGKKNTGIPYLSKYPDQFTNDSICPVTHTLVMSKQKSAINEVDSNNKSGQSDLALENFWVTKCGWLQLFTTVAMGMTIHIFLKLFRC